MALLNEIINSLCNRKLFGGKYFVKLVLFSSLADLLQHLTNKHYNQNINTKVLLLTCWAGIVDCWKRK